MAEEGVHAKEFDFEDWLAEGIKGFRGCCKEYSPLLPEEFRQHTKVARREMLLAMRSLLDAAIECAEEKPKKKAQKDQGGVERSGQPFASSTSADPCLKPAQH